LLSWLSTRDRPTALPQQLEPDRSTSAIFVLGEVEPPQYSPQATAAALEDLADEGLLSASIGVLPFLFMAQKTRYRAAGGVSQAARQLDTVAERLSVALKPGHVGLVEAVWCEGDRSLASRVVAAVSRGFRSVVIAEAVVAESLEVDRAKKALDVLRLGDLGITVSYAGPLWRSERIAAAITGRVLAVAGDLSAAGVVLIGQGQPEGRSRDRRAFDEQEIAFLNRVRMLLVDRGVPDQSVRIAWADWRSPEVTGTVRHLAALGCRRIVVSPSCFPLDSITTMLDLKLSVRQARVDETVSVITLPAYHDDPAFIEELRTGIASLMPDSMMEADASIAHV
jgi:hypothetical protein